MTANAEWVCYIVSKEEGLSEHGFLFSGALITRKHVITVAQAVKSYVAFFRFFFLVAFLIF